MLQYSRPLKKKKLRQSLGDGEKTKQNKKRIVPQFLIMSHWPSAAKGQY